MSLYDEVSVAEGNRVNIPPPKTFYQTNSFDCVLSYLSIDKGGTLRYDTNCSRPILSLDMDMYGEDETGYGRRYRLCVIANRIEMVHEIKDNGNFTEIYVSPALKRAQQYRFPQQLGYRV